MEWPMKVKTFEVVLHKLPSGKSPATALEEQLNAFLGERPQLQLVTTTHMNTHGLTSRTECYAKFGGFLHYHFLHPLLHGLETSSAAPQHHPEIPFKQNIVCLPSRLNPCTNI
jgi:hypothetical protein